MDDKIIFKTAIQVLLFIVLIVAAVTDLRDRKVYNWLTLPAIIFGFTLAWATADSGQGFAALADRFITGFLPAVLIFGVAVWVGGMGAGDLKLMAAIGAIKGFPFVLEAMFWSGVVGAVMALGKLAWDGALLKGIKQSVRYSFSLGAPREEETLLQQKIPYGVAISVGTMFNWFMELTGGT